LGWSRNLQEGGGICHKDRLVVVGIWRCRVFFTVLHNLRWRVSCGEGVNPHINIEEHLEEERTMAENNSGVSGLGWFLAGLGLGAVVGVLYAPKAGKETREDIVNSALEAKERAAAYAQQGVDKANEYVAQSKQAAGEYVDKGKEYYEKGRSQWTQYVEKGKSLVQDQQEKVAAAIEAGKEAYSQKVDEFVS